MNHEHNRPRHPLLHSLRNVAAILLAVILLSSAMIAWGNSQTAHALKFRMEKMFYDTGNNQPSAEEDEGIDENVITMKITDPSELAALKRQIPELLIPEKLPEGYEFSSAEVNRWKNEEWEVVLSYSNDDEQFNIKQNNYEDNFDMFLKLNAEEISLSNGVAYYLEENDIFRGIFLVSANYTQIFGTLEKEKLLQIAEQLQ